MYQVLAHSQPELSVFLARFFEASQEQTPALAFVRAPQSWVQAASARSRNHVL